jgi:hypothetical protein
MPRHFTGKTGAARKKAMGQHRTAMARGRTTTGGSARSTARRAAAAGRGAGVRARLGANGGTARRRVAKKVTRRGTGMTTRRSVTRR